MTKFLLNLQRKGAGFSPCVATCSITGDPIGFQGSQREFYPESTLVAALEVAGIAEHRFASAVQILRSGFGGSFLEISEEEGRELGVLAKVAS